MIYREAGVYHTDYRADMALFRVPMARWASVGVLVIAVIIPFFATDYWFSAIFIPFLTFTIATMGLNLMTGYAGQISLGHAAFIAVGGYAATILLIYDVPFLATVVLAGLTAALVGLVFGIPSARIKGLYLAMATLAAQFVLPWAISRVVPLVVPTGLAVAGGDTVYPPRPHLFGWEINTLFERYFVCLAILVVMTLLAMNLVRSRVGRAWVAIHDHDVAAKILGIDIMQYKLLAFAIGSFYAGVSGALMVFFYYGVAHVGEFGLDLSLRLLGAIIIGGLGSTIGSFFGTAFIILMPIFLNVFLTFLGNLSGFDVGTGIIAGVENMVFGALVVVLLIVEPLGLAKIWQNLKDYFRLWPFSY
ncbi:MAG: branched-chain amino acid ABC transporter permease [Anaerolineae bacterium]